MCSSDLLYARAATSDAFADASGMQRAIQGVASDARRTYTPGAITPADGLAWLATPSGSGEVSVLAVSDRGGVAVVRSPLAPRSAVTGDQAFLFTDRPVVRPGQTVNWKLFARRGGASGYTMPETTAVSLALQGPGQSLRLAFNILQAAGCRSFKTDYVACPSCGRTLFNLQTVTARIKARTDHLKGVKIAIMGCIVNGPGEMADADFGYVGGAPNKINLYVGKKPVRFNIPEDEAVERLVDLIREHGKWREPEVD